MKFEQEADFEIIKKDGVSARLNNEAQQVAKSVLVDPKGQVSQKELVAMFGEDVVLKLENTFTVEQVRDGKVIHTETISNSVTNLAINDILDTYFGATAKKAAFYLGLIDNVGFTAVSVNDTMASHAGWAEFQTYDEAVRQTWTAAAASGQAITGTAVSEVTIGTITAQSLQGLFVTDNSTKGGATGFLWSTALFSTPAPIVTADVFRLTYTLRLGN